MIQLDCASNILNYKKKTKNTNQFQRKSRLDNCQMIPALGSVVSQVINVTLEYGQRVLIQYTYFPYYNIFTNQSLSSSVIMQTCIRNICLHTFQNDCELDIPIVLFNSILNVIVTFICRVFPITPIYFSILLFCVVSLLRAASYVISISLEFLCYCLQLTTQILNNKIMQAIDV